MARKLKSDKLLFLATVLLVGASIIMVYSASAVVAEERYGRPFLFLFKQITWALLGGLLMWLVMRLDYRTYRQPVAVWTILAVVGVTLVAVLFSTPINGTRRWFGTGLIGIQPSEFAKLAAIVFTAAFLERRMDRINDASATLLPIGAVVGIMVALILAEPDFGTAFSLVLIVGLMLFAAGLHYRYLVGTALVVLPLAYLAIMSAEYRRRRIEIWWDPWRDPLGDGFQIIQSLIAVGTGGVSGRGLGQGVQKLFFLPEPFTDFIYAVIAEELGLLGATGVLVGFVVIAWRGLAIAQRAPDRFGALLAVGLTLMIVVQALVNISVVLKLMPTKGIPLPLISAGGSSLLVSLVGMGMLLNVSQHTSDTG